MRATRLLQGILGWLHYLIRTRAVLTISSTETTIAGISKMVRTENYEIVLPVVATRRAIARWKAFSILIPMSYRTGLGDDGLAFNHCFEVGRSCCDNGNQRYRKMVWGRPL
jgi:hypothetical protein